MRVCQVNDIAFEAGGAEKSVLLIRDGLRKRGHEVMVVATSTALGEHDPFADLVIDAVTGSALRRLASYTWYQKAYAALRAVVREYRPDLVHLHAIGEFSPSVLCALHGVPTVLTVHGPEDYTLNLLPWQLPASDYRDGSYERCDLRVRGRLRLAYLRYLERPAYRLGFRPLRRVLAPSEFMAASLAGDFPEGRIHVLYNGIELPLPAPFRDEGHLLYVGRFARVKGVHYLLQAMARVVARVPHAKLVLAGDGPERHALIALASELGITPHVHFAGWLGARELRATYMGAAALVVPSIWPENLPTVAIEALATGRAIIGSRVGGLPELISDGVTGRLVPKARADSLADAAVEILSDPQKARAMGARAAAFSQRFALEPFLDGLEQHYECAVRPACG
jgi:glycosyltransferase involved in cell wall biosynthesis